MAGHPEYIMEKDVFSCNFGNTWSFYNARMNLIFCLNNSLISIFSLPSFLSRELFVIFFYVKSWKITLNVTGICYSIIFCLVNDSNNEEVLIFLSLRKLKETEA